MGGDEVVQLEIDVLTCGVIESDVGVPLEGVRLEAVDFDLENAVRDVQVRPLAAVSRLGEAERPCAVVRFLAAILQHEQLLQLDLSPVVSHPRPLLFRPLATVRGYGDDFDDPTLVGCAPDENRVVFEAAHSLPAGQTLADDRVGSDHPGSESSESAWVGPFRRAEDFPGRGRRGEWGRWWWCPSGRGE